MATHLSSLDVLVVDCQATAPSPTNGHLLEVGWGSVRTDRDEVAVESRLVTPPEGTTLPKQVRRVTGISDEELAAGSSAESVWAELVAAADRIAGVGGSEKCPTIIHFSRFEEPYLRFLGGGANESFPLEIVCTHEIARRLLPRLPRRGLRALAGFFGHAVPDGRRAAHHVEATAAVWRRIVGQLEHDVGVRTLEDLDAWLSTSTPPRAPTAPRHEYPMPAKRRRALPDRPGVYRMLRASGDILYIGKATSLRQRVATYFQKSTKHADHILEMLTQAHDVETFVTGSALEAALEETDQIKRHVPAYNKALRPEGRRLVFATKDFTQLSETADGAHRLGPLPDSDALAAASRLARASTDDVSASETVAVPDAYAPTEDTLFRGLAIYRAAGGSRSVLVYGAALWRERQRLVDAQPEPELRLKVEYDEGVERWTPESVAARLGELAARASHLVRRAHWLSILSESSLEWDRGVIGFRGGVIRSRSDRVISRPRNAPFEERRKRFDLAAYDRMTVLLKELRRLAAGERPLRLHTADGASLSGPRLREVLRWI